MKRMRRDGQVPNSTSTHWENTSPPIFDLPHDVLRTIFSLNAQHFVDLEQSENGFSVMESPNSDDPLLTTRRASQVCRQWRDLILSSPTLWEKALDLNSLAAGKPEWTTEVLKRTGNAPLTVVGQMINRQKFPVSFLETIVLCHWCRIKALIIIRFHSFRTNGNAHFDKVIRNLLTRPAPNLQNCIIIDTNDNYARVVGDQTDPLFGGQAPKLQSMTLLNDSCFDGSKLSNLRRFYLLWTQLYPVDVILTALAGMPLLEELELEMDPDEGLTKQRTVRSSVIELRYLRKIALYNSFKWLGHLVQWVVPKHGCTLFHYVTDSCDIDTDLTTVEVIEFGREAYTTFLGRYLDATELTELSYTMECGNEDESPCLEIKARRKKMIHPELRVNEDGDEYPLFFTYEGVVILRPLKHQDLDFFDVTGKCHRPQSWL
uniref:F-box domain-containing protein n=1 Tax=Psilocybe cubensis TaxID=181762 RepID=A0A8H8CKA1_PSICU